MVIAELIYLVRLVPLDAGFNVPGMAATLTGLNRGGGNRDAVFAGDTVFCVETVNTSPCLSNSSPIVIFLSATGILLTRISSRIRRPCACRAY